MENGGCEQICVDTYDGYCCLCRPGYELTPLTDVGCEGKDRQIVPLFQFLLLWVLSDVSIYVYAYLHQMFLALTYASLLNVKY